MLLLSHYSEFLQCLSVQFIWRVEGGMFIVEDVGTWLVWVAGF